MSVNGPTVHHAFSEHYYRKQTQFKLEYQGVPIVKCPFDLWIYQQIIYDTQPDVIVETGTFGGGSALWLADQCQQLCHRPLWQIVSVDLEQRPELPEHDRIHYIAGKSSTSKEAVQAVCDLIKPLDRVMVILDSDHSASHVYDELMLYSPLVTPGCYLIVEDTNYHAYPGQRRNYGPAQAIKDWQPTNRGFEIDRSVEIFGFSQNPGGFLKRVRS